MNQLTIVINPPAGLAAERELATSDKVRLVAETIHKHADLFGKMFDEGGVMDEALKAAGIDPGPDARQWTMQTRLGIYITVTAENV